MVEKMSRAPHWCTLLKWTQQELRRSSDIHSPSQQDWMSWNDSIDQIHEHLNKLPQDVSIEWPLIATLKCELSTLLHHYQRFLLCVLCCSQRHELSKQAQVCVVLISQSVCSDISWLCVGRCFQWSACTDDSYSQDEWLLGKLLRPSETRSGSPVHSILAFSFPSGKQRWK